MKWHIRNEVKRGAKLYKVVGKFKNGKPKKRVFYTCSYCAGHFKSDQVQVDHIDAIGRFNGCWNEYIARMFCDVANLQVLCKGCHNKKSTKDKRKM